MRSVALSACVLVLVVCVTPARSGPAAAGLDARLRFQQRVLRHDAQVQAWFHRRGVRLLQNVTPRRRTAAYRLWWSIQQARWVRRELRETRALIARRDASRQRALLGNVANWTCIHGFEGSWTDAGDPYWGGLQMDRDFMQTYGADMIRRHGGTSAYASDVGLANTWTPVEQMVVAQRAYSSGRGYYPWPNTARYCGLI